jgi:hypothetical protein
MYGKRPSEIIGVTEEYDAYCFDEAVAYIILKMENGDQPKYQTKYTSASDYYKSLGNLSYK